eukprot:CAMPEP_0205912832 /NCGR_PEP_ID=MMETSP1325-20131115/6113_1 /ASSEMBLY_ACC=CAM_ASM_000708 /TAXON_ID=236786 /ORGANISM="Florenciella sp., Strain RCC1007" /LENGTH=35 /DNA_ID= /DNA_START= /DNA_END= /DNA_ORIENTATION=
MQTVRKIPRQQMPPHIPAVAAAATATPPPPLALDM